MLSRLVISFLPRSKHLSISWLQVPICSDFEAQKNKVWHCFHCFAIYLPWNDGTDAMILVFWMLSFKPTFSLSFFTFIKGLFSSCLLSAVRVVSSAYLRLLIFLLAILIPTCASSCFTWFHPNFYFHLKHLLWAPGLTIPSGYLIRISKWTWPKPVLLPVLSNLFNSASILFNSTT